MWPSKNKKVAKGLTALMAVVLTFAVATGCGKKDEQAAAPGQPGEVVVTYKDGGQVTRAEFDKFLGINTFFYKDYAQFKEDPAFQQDMMKQLVTFKVLSSRADDKAKAEADKKTKEQMEQIKTFLDMQGGMDQQLKDASLTKEDVEQFILRSNQAIVSIESKVTDQQMQDSYKKRLEQDKNAYDVATVSHILIGTSDPATGQEKRTKEEALKIAKEVQDKLKKGGDFAALAKEYSEDPGSKDQGGKYENVEISQWVPAFKKAAAELPLNTVSEPVETEYGYHVMKVESRKTKTFDEVKDSLRSEAAETTVYDFVEKELPTLIEKNNLPKPEDKPATPATPAPAQQK
ncbi:peptidylprolyl isomerase [Paenibacillus sp. GD4]|jgi:foldase protein PrsA|uniref:peptidylprolyl isomerase n=1 Tax=Paenibacillus TaxID=44249 RepID=UPI0025434B6D|nr:MULTISPECIES: peptidylprolyl isomerase [Paenibacillus]MDQ1910945.1 peptidylprolyl isomerase [Paenibacillus sp. GD4]